MDLNTVVAEAAEGARARWSTESARADMPIEFMLELEMPTAAADVDALHEAAENLVHNALEATLPGGSIVVRTWIEGSWLCCSISDTGLGMTTETQQRAIEPFFTTRGVQRRGLGLSASLGIVRGHGGDLTVASEVGRGTTVTFRLPAAQP